MKKQMTVVDLGVVFAAVIIAIILISASQWYSTSNAPTVSNFPEVQNGQWVVKESPVEIGAGSESADQVDTGEFSPATGAGVNESSAPLESQSAQEAAAIGGAQ